MVEASAVAVAAVAYLKTVPNLGTDVETCYLIGKSKVAPIKQISIPKLELEAAVIRVRLLSTILKESSLHITRSTIWTDSQVVLDWLSTTKKQPAFVANNLKEILASTGAFIGANNRPDTVLNLEQVAPDFSNSLQFGLSDQKAKD